MDDDFATTDVFASFVHHLGYKARTALSAEAALLIASSEKIELAVVDIRMPGHGGDWLIEQLERRYPHIPIVIATGLSELDPRLTLRPSVAGYLVKPISAEDLGAMLDGILSEVANPPWPYHSGRSTH